MKDITSFAEFLAELVRDTMSGQVVAKLPEKKVGTITIVPTCIKHLTN